QLVDSNTAIDMLDDVDVSFLCLPHGTSMGVVYKLLAKNRRIIDLSGDFRFKDVSIYEKWYEKKHLFADILHKAVYGLPELFREKIKKANLIANPGCYATSVIVPLYPLLRKGLIKGTVIADCKSGVSGAGRKSELRLMFSEVNGNFTAYSVSGHRHNPEMEEVLAEATGFKPEILFVPHLVPINRGILSTIYVDIDENYTWDDVRDIYHDFYGDEPFVKLYPKGRMPEVREVRNSNYIAISWEVRRDKGKLVIVSAIDNLVKGASGQAVQNMNLMLGFEETVGLVSLSSIV
ncbi:MAG: N-acetyl-gamma-glutamyl-phosphate reductase, partial [Thermosulfidibacteraceae bacterium]